MTVRLAHAPPLQISARSAIVTRMFPFGIVRVWVLGIGGLLQVVGAIDYLRAWFATEPAKHRFLVQGTGMLIASFAIPLLALLFSHRRRPARSPLSNATTSFLDRPDGSRIFVESLGPANAPTIVLTHGWAVDSTIWPTPFLHSPRNTMARGAMGFARIGLVVTRQYRAWQHRVRRHARRELRHPRR